jgi:hypothetical protein
LPLPTSVDIRPCCVPSTHVMRLRSGRNTRSTLSNKSLSISNREFPELYPIGHHNFRRRGSRHARRRHPLFHRLCNLSRLYLNRQLHKWRLSSLSDLPSPRFMQPIPKSIRLVLDDLNLPFFDPLSKDTDLELDAEVTIS